LDRGVLVFARSGSEGKKQAEVWGLYNSAESQKRLNGGKEFEAETLSRMRRSVALCRNMKTVENKGPHKLGKEGAKRENHLSPSGPLT